MARSWVVIKYEDKLFKVRPSRDSDDALTNILPIPGLPRKLVNGATEIYHTRVGTVKSREDKHLAYDVAAIPVAIIQSHYNSEDKAKVYETVIYEDDRTVIFFDRYPHLQLIEA